MPKFVDDGLTPDRRAYERETTRMLEAEDAEYRKTFLPFGPADPEPCHYCGRVGCHEERFWAQEAKRQGDEWWGPDW